MKESNEIANNKNKITNKSQNSMIKTTNKIGLHIFFWKLDFRFLNLFEFWCLRFGISLKINECFALRETLTAHVRNNN